MSVYAQKGGTTPTTVPVGTCWSYDLLGWAYDNSLRTWTSPGEWRFRGQDSFYGTRGYAPDFDYPNPAGHAWIQRQYTSDLRTWINPGGQRRFVGQDTFYGTKGKAPTFDYPNPVGHAWLQRQYTSDLRTFIVPGGQRRFLGQDIFYGGRGKAPTFDYPNPKGYYTTNYSWYKDWILNLRETPNVALLPLPFDWGYQEKLQWYRDWILNATIRLPITVVTAPFNQDDWPNPKFNPTLDYSYIEFMDLARNASLGKPFRQTDWPNPQVITWYKDWNNNLILIVPVVAGTPFSQSDWPLPLAPTYWARDWNQNLILTFGPTPPVVTTDLHFKPIRTSMGRMGNLGGLH